MKQVIQKKKMEKGRTKKMDNEKKNEKRCKHEK